MKKNKIMRLAALLLVVCLMTTSMLSATFAKYTTEDYAGDGARVAKWGVSLQVVGTLYGESYQECIVSNTEENIEVQSIDFARDGRDSVVAPGTCADEGFHISLTGTPEVATSTYVTIMAQNVFLNAGEYGLMVEVPAGAVDAENFGYLGDLYTEDGGSYTLAASYTDGATYYTLEDKVDTTSLGTYYPVVYTMEGDTTYSGDDSVDTINMIAMEIAKLFAEGNDEANVKVTTDADTNITTYEVRGTELAPNVDLDDYFKADDLKITWKWAFRDYVMRGENVSVESKADTILGLLMNRAANGHTDELDGVVVMKSGDSYIAPTEHEHFCLDTGFGIDINVNQDSFSPQ